MIWRRYFLKEFISVFLLMIVSCYFLFVLIDYSAHTKTFHQPGIRVIDVLLYYLFQFSKRAEIVAALSVLVATVKVLTTLSSRGEITALATSGISLRRLLSPFLLAAGLTSVALYLNFQIVQPVTSAKLEAFEARYFKESNENKTHSLTLSDNTTLFYHHYDPAEKALYDVFWVKDFDHLYHIKKLEPYGEVPKGHYVDLIERSAGKKGHFTQTDRKVVLALPQMHFDTRVLSQKFLPPSSQPLTKLAKVAKLGIKKMPDREALATCALYYKLLIPLLPLFVVVAVAPFCFCFGRHLSIYLIYTFSLFGFICYFTLVNASVILGQSQLIPIFWALCLPPALLGAFCVWNYAKLQ